MLCKLVRDGLGEDPTAPPVVEPAGSPAGVRLKADTTARAQRSADPNVLAGVPASPGIAVGNVVQRIDGLGHVVSYAYDALNRMTQETDAARLMSIRCGLGARSMQARGQETAPWLPSAG